MKYSIIIINKNIEDLSSCLDSIDNIDYSKEKYEIIIEDLVGNAKDIISNYDFNNISVFSCKDILSGYNHGLKVLKGSYVSFINSDFIYEDKKTFWELDNIFASNKIAVLNAYFYDKILFKRQRYTYQPKKEEPIDLNVQSYRISSLLEAYFINTELIKDLEFSKSEERTSSIMFLIELFNKCNSFYFTSSLTILSNEPFDDNVSKCVVQNDKKWYKESLSNYLKLLKRMKKIPIFVEQFIYTEIFKKYNCNLNESYKQILTSDEYNDFVNILTDILVLLSDKTILQKSIFDEEDNKIKPIFVGPRWLKYYFMDLKLKYLKENREIKMSFQNDEEVITFYRKKNKKIISEEVINSKNSEKVNIYAINYKNGKLYFDCTTSIKDFLYENEVNIRVRVNGQDISVRKNNFYPYLKAFGQVVSFKYGFSFSLNIPKNCQMKLEILAVIDDEIISLKNNFVKIQARLTNSKRSYWHHDNFILLNKENFIVMKKYSPIKVLGYEFLYDLSKLKNCKKKIRVIKLIVLRILYYLTKPFFQNKNIWLSFDKLYKAGDNGEYVYQYGLKNRKNIYYIIKKDSPDFERLVKQNKKHILIFNSLRQKLYFLHSEVILKTHANILGFCGFDGMARTLISGLFNAEVMEIQHGLTIQDIPEYQNRLVDNIKQYFIASKYEEKNIKKPIYDYNKDIIKYTGLARYDGLKNHDKRIILITPTWRHNLASQSVKHGTPRSHNDTFKQSKYFEIYNSLINNPKLIEAAKENKYKIVYLIHPTLSGQIEDFDKNDYVDIIPATGDMSYEKILTESSLMVTDYSGVQYDFAYMRKPIIYFHPDELPPHYSNETIDYQKDGFGPISKNIEDLIKNLCDYMKNNCMIQEKYKKRADKFFIFKDYNNCKRIINYVDEYMNDLKNK